jgi:hypothetical protein
MSVIASGTQWMIDTGNPPAPNHSACAWCLSSGAGGVQVPYAIQGAAFFAGTPFFDNTSSANWQFFSQDVGVVNLGVSATAAPTFIGYTRTDNAVNGTSIYTGTGGALTQTGPTGSAVANTPTSVVVGNQLVTAVPMLGNVWAFMCWDAVLSADEMQAQYLHLRPVVRPQALTRWLPMWNVASVNADWSGSGNTPTVTGTYTNSRLIPPIPYAALNR